MRLGSPYRHRIEFLALRTALGVLTRVPFPVACGLGAALGRLAWFALPRRRAIALANLDRVWGAERSPSERRRIAQASFVSLGRLVADFAQARNWTASDLGRFVEYEGWEHFEAARATGRGVLFLAAHFGSWELIPQAQALRGAPMSFIVRPADNPRVEALIREIRECHGNRVIEKRNAVRECLRRLRAGETVGILIDQRVAADQGVPTPFLGQSVSTTPVVAALASRTGATVLPAFIYQRPAGRHQICIGPPVETPVSRERDDVDELTRRCVAVVETHVARAPEHWLWVHRRFRASDGAPSSDDSGLERVVESPGVELTHRTTLR